MICLLLGLLLSKYVCSYLLSWVSYLTPLSQLLPSWSSKPAFPFPGMLSVAQGYAVVAVEWSCGGDNPSTPSACLEAVAFTSRPLGVLCSGFSLQVWNTHCTLWWCLAMTSTPSFTVYTKVFSSFQQSRYQGYRLLLPLFLVDIYWERRDLQIPPSDCSFPCLVMCLSVFSSLGNWVRDFKPCMLPLPVTDPFPFSIFFWSFWPWLCSFSPCPTLSDPCLFLL